MLGQFERLERLQKKVAKHADPEAKRARYAGSVAATYRRLYPAYIDAPHLVPLFDLFERAARGERVYACVSLPPRAGKTETLIAGIVDRLARDPAARIGYAAYSGRLAQKKSGRVRMLAIQEGIEIDPSSRSKQDWRTMVGEGGLWATSCGGSIIGEGFELLVLDDLIRSRADAESPVIRDDAHAWIIADALTRMEPNGSVIVCGTRYHTDDPIGRLLESGGWEEIRVPALDDADESYWPERWTAQRLHEIREEKGGRDGYDWCSLYQGEPRAPGDAIFRDAHYVEELAGHSPRIALGVDFAYTVGKSSDYSCAVVLAEWMGVYYVVDVLRVRMPEEQFRARVVELCRRWGAQFVVGYIAATEQPNIDLLAREVPAIGRRAVADKKTRALPTAAGWNLGRIKVLSGRPWVREFVREVVSFTGADRHDDQVDALAAVYDAMHVAAAFDWSIADELADAAPGVFPGFVPGPSLTTGDMRH